MVMACLLAFLENALMCLFWLRWVFAAPRAFLQLWRVQPARYTGPLAGSRGSGVLRLQQLQQVAQELRLPSPRARRTGSAARPLVGSSRPGIEPVSPALAEAFLLYCWATREAQFIHFLFCHRRCLFFQSRGGEC